MWRRSVMKRSPLGRASTRAGRWRVAVMFSSRAATPRRRKSRGPPVQQPVQVLPLVVAGGGDLSPGPSR